MPRQLKIAVIFLTAAIGVLLLAVVAYVLYVYLQYYRIDDGQILTVSSEKTDTIRTGKTYSVMTYNIGFGAYGPDFSFFMDSGVMDTGEKKTGRYGKAIDRQSVTDNIAGSVAAVRAADCDFVLRRKWIRTDRAAITSTRWPRSRKILPTLRCTPSIFIRPICSGR